MIPGVKSDSGRIVGTRIEQIHAKERRKLGVKELPGSLAESLTELEKDTLLTEALGDSTCEAFLRAKWEEWDEFRLRVSDYEIERYLETA